MTLNAILRQKPDDLFVVRPDTCIEEVVTLLADKGIGAVLVLDDRGALTGILSERDIVRGLANHAHELFAMQAAALMTPHPVTATPATTVVAAMQVMTKGRFRHLPVLEQGGLAGVVSIGDVVRARIDQQRHEVEALRIYVAGRV